MGGWQYYVDEIRGPRVAGGTFTPFTAKVASSSFLSSLVVPPLRCGGLPSAANSSARRRLAPDVLRKVDPPPRGCDAQICQGSLTLLTLTMSYLPYRDGV